MGWKKLCYVTATGWWQNGIKKPTKTTNKVFYEYLRYRSNSNTPNEKLKKEQQQILAIIKREFPDKIDEIDKIRWFVFGLEETMLQLLRLVAAKRHPKTKRKQTEVFYEYLRNRSNSNTPNEKLKKEQQQTLAILKREFPDRIDEIDKIRWFAFGLEEVMLRHCDWLAAKRHPKPNNKTNKVFYQYLRNRSNSNTPNEKLKKEQQQTLAILNESFQTELTKLTQLTGLNFPAKCQSFIVN